MRKLVLMCSLAMVVPGFAACGESDEVDEGGAGGGGGGGGHTGGGGSDAGGSDAGASAIDAAPTPAVDAMPTGTDAQARAE